jgi:hypothetical protein
LKSATRLLVLFLLLGVLLSGCSGGGKASDQASNASGGQGSQSDGAPAPAAGGNTASVTPQASPYGFAWGEYGLGIPGVSYQIDQGNQIIQVSSTGAQTASTLKLNQDGTYVWNSQWDGKVYKGNWQKGDSSYPVVIPKAQEGKTWKVGKDDKSDGLYVWDGNSIYYIGKWVRP